MTEIETHLSSFTKREDALLKRLEATGLLCPPRLNERRTWIADSAIYLNELKTFVEQAENAVTKN